MAPKKQLKTSTKMVRRVAPRVLRKANRKRPPSSFEKAIHLLLKEEEIVFIKEKTIGRCHADVFMNPKTVVELNGCYWHYHQECQAKPPNAMQLKALSKDSSRYAFFRRLGFDVQIIWECSLKKDPEGVRDRLVAIAKKAKSK